MLEIFNTGEKTAHQKYLHDLFERMTSYWSAKHTMTYKPVEHRETGCPTRQEGGLEIFLWMEWTLRPMASDFGT